MKYLFIAKIDFERFEWLDSRLADETHIAIIGSSGSGKSSFVRSILHLGSSFFCGLPLQEIEIKIGEIESKVLS